MIFIFIFRIDHCIQDIYINIINIITLVKICVAKSLDANGLEHVFGNLGSFMFGIMVLWYFNIVINFYVISSWFGFVTICTCINHSNNKCALDNNIHFNHHKYRNCNYGFGLYLMDRVMNTYKE